MARKTKLFWHRDLELLAQQRFSEVERREANAEINGHFHMVCNAASRAANTSTWRVLICLLSAVTLQNIAPLARAQIIPDTTLPNNSEVPNNCTTCAITGGSLSNDQQTLFHSFQQFSVPTGGAALFQNDPSLVNIVTRVTGENRSTIDGLVAAQGNVDLFLINPNGIVFGPNAVLQLPGSFIASSANSLVFEDNAQWSAISPAEPPLLTVSTPVGLQFGAAPGDILVEGPGNFPPTLPGLFVTPGHTLALAGRNVDIVGGTVSAPAGRIELGSSTQSTVRFVPTNNGYDLTFDSVQNAGGQNAGGQNAGNVRLRQGGLLNANGPGGGDIDIQSQTALIEQGSQVLTVTTGATAGGNLRITAPESVTVRGASPNGQTISRVGADTTGTGTGGNLVVNTGTLRVSDRALLSASTGGDGRGGNLDLNATEAIELKGTGYESLQTLFLGALQGGLDISAAESGLIAGSGGAGNAGRLVIDTPRLQLQEGALISTTASGSGAGGNATITTTESVDIVGSIILTGTLQGTTQQAGDLTLDTQRLSLREGGLLQTFTFGSGKGGSLVVNADESVELSSTPINAVVPTGIFANSIFGTGTGGNIKVNTSQLSMTGGSQIGNQTGAFLGTGIIPFGGPAGDVVITVDGTTLISGLSADGRFTSGPGTASFSNADAGNILLTTGNLFIQAGSDISTTTFGNGNGGTLTVEVEETLEISGTGTRTPSGAPITSPSSLVSSSGRADFPGRVGSGNAGTLQVSAGELILREGGAIAINSLGPGDAGTLSATADLIRLDSGSTITAATTTGAGGNVILETPVLVLRQGSSINSDAGNADGGNITLNGLILMALENSDITANALQGRGGQVNITAQNIIGTTFRTNLTAESDITATSALGPDFNGEVVINTPDAEPDSGLMRLPAATADPNEQIIAGCASDYGNRFVVSHQGGLPASPSQRITSSSGGWQDLRFLDERPTVNATIDQPVNSQPSNNPSSSGQSSSGQSSSGQSSSGQSSRTEHSTVSISSQEPAQTASFQEANLVQQNERGETVLIARAENELNLSTQHDISGSCAAHRKQTSRLPAER